MSDSIEIVDDRDPRVAYSGVWRVEGVKEEYNSTTHGAFTAGSRATFTFKGSSVEVYGTTSNSAPFTDAAISTYSIDGSPPEIFNPPPPSKISYRQKFYSSPVLDDEQHILVITSTVSNTAFWLDYFQIASNGLQAPRPDPATPTTLITTTTPDTTTKSVSQPSSSLLPGSPSQTSTRSLVSYGPTVSFVTSSNAPQGSTDTPVLSANNTPPIGPIVGGVIGGVILVLLSCLFILCYRWRRRSQSGSSASGTQPPLQMENTRFIGDVSPFTGHWTRASGSDSDRTGSASESRITRDTGHIPRSVAAFQKTGMPDRRSGDPYNPAAAEILPPYSGR